jgi:high-affinity nickel permease
MECKMEILKNLANLVKVKTIVTLIVVAIYAYLAITGQITADNVMIITSMVVSFYFGTQHERKGGASNGD